MNESTTLVEITPKMGIVVIYILVLLFLLDGENEKEENDIFFYFIQ